MSCLELYHLHKSHTSEAKSAGSVGTLKPGAFEEGFETVPERMLFSDLGKAQAELHCDARVKEFAKISYPYRADYAIEAKIPKVRSVKGLGHASGAQNYHIHRIR